MNEGAPDEAYSQGNSWGDPFAKSFGASLAGLACGTEEKIPCGAIESDFLGRITRMNSQAKSMLGLSGAAVGREFFSDLCPWAHSPLFLGRFVQGVRKGSFDETFPFVLKVGRELRLVSVRLLLAENSSRVWILLR